MHTILHGQRQRELPHHLGQPSQASQTSQITIFIQWCLAVRIFTQTLDFNKEILYFWARNWTWGSLAQALDFVNFHACNKFPTKSYHFHMEMHTIWPGIPVNLENHEILKSIEKNAIHRFFITFLSASAFRRLRRSSGQGVFNASAVDLLHY